MGWLGLFAVECKSAGSLSNFKSGVLCREIVDCSQLIGVKSLPQVKEFKYLGLLFMSEGKLVHEMDRWCGAAAAVI